MIGNQRPLGMSYWPLADDDPGVEPGREEIRLVTQDGALVRGILWTPPGGARWKTAILLAHPRGDFSVHYACPLLAAAGFAVLGFTTRYLNHDADCLQEACVVDDVAAVEEMRRRGAASVMALAQAETGCGDAWVGVAAHPGEGVFMESVIDPSVADESEPLSVVPELDMYDPRNGWRPWPEPCRYDPAWLATYRAAQRARIARIDAIARGSLADNERNRLLARKAERGGEDWRAARRRAVHTPYMVIYRTLANPAYLDLSIEPDDRPMGSLFAFPDPFDGNWGRFGLGRVMTARGWLSTWSSLSSRARLSETIPKVTVPTLVLHPTADTEIRLREAREIRDRAGASDVTYREMKGAPHYLEGHRPEVMRLVAQWIRERFG